MHDLRYMYALQSLNLANQSVMPSLSSFLPSYPPQLGIYVRLIHTLPEKPIGYPQTSPTPFYTASGSTSSLEAHPLDGHTELS